MNIPVFLSCSGPFTKEQDKFKTAVKKYLRDYLGFEARTLGETDYDPEEPLTACRRLMMDCNGLITLAFRRYYVEIGYEYPDMPRQMKSVDEKTGKILKKKKSIDGLYFTSPWCQIEAAMAFSLGLPILVFREKGVSERGLMKKGISGLYLPEFDLETHKNYLDEPEWREIINEWGGWVRAVRRSKGFPPRLY